MSARSLGDYSPAVQWTMRTGQANLETIRCLDENHTRTFGHPEPTPVRRSARRGHCIAVSGHDLLDLKNLLEATKDIPNLYIYTHGEMLPAYSYPELKKYRHFAGLVPFCWSQLRQLISSGHYGTAWQNQLKEFSSFPVG